MLPSIFFGVLSFALFITIILTMKELSSQRRINRLLQGQLDCLAGVQGLVIEPKLLPGGGWEINVRTFLPPFKTMATACEKG